MSINHAGTGGTSTAGEDKVLQQMVCNGHGGRCCGGGRIPQEGHRANLVDGKVIKEAAVHGPCLGADAGCGFRGQIADPELPYEPARLPVIERLNKGRCDFLSPPSASVVWPGRGLPAT
jgi:hypothetical protein